MDLFQLANDESYDKRCGEIILTTKRNISIHCTLCEVVYKDFDAYAGHLYKQHSTTLNTLGDSLSLEEKDISDGHDNIKTDTKDIVPKIKEEIEALENDFFKEEELPIETLLEVESGVTENEEVDSLSSIQNIELPKEIEGMDLDIPSVIRNVNRRILRGPSTVSAEDLKYKCPICGLGFKGKYNMKYHLKRHSLEKNHECSECDKKFHTSTEVRVHMRSHIRRKSNPGRKGKNKQHSSEKNQECLECRRNCHTIKEDRTRFHTCERRFLCSYCGRSFLNNSHLSRHVKRHTNKRDFKCEICNKAFFESDTLKRHMRGHSSERPFACEICPAKFSRQTTLRNHEKLHENKREYKCNLCGMGFNQQAGVSSHMKVVHK